MCLWDGFNASHVADHILSPRCETIKFYVLLFSVIPDLRQDVAPSPGPPGALIRHVPDPSAVYHFVYDAIRAPRFIQIHKNASHDPAGAPITTGGRLRACTHKTAASLHDVTPLHKSKTSEDIKEPANPTTRTLAHLVVDAQRHLQDLLREEEEVEAAEDADGVVHVVVRLGVEAQRLRRVGGLVFRGF